MAKATRMKAKAINTPTSQQQAEAMLLKIGELQNEVARIESDMNDELAAIKKSYEEEAQPHNTEIAELFQGVHAWAESNREVLLKGKGKTAPIATGELSWKTTPPKVSIRGMADVIAAFKTHGMTEFVRTKDEVNKEAILADQDSRERAQTIKGVSITQTEEFIAKPFASQIERVETMKKQEAA